MELLKDKTILIIGLGLIGGSVARALTAGKLCRRVVAYGRDEAVLQVAMLDGSIHGFSTELSVVVPQADLILIAVPTLTVRPVLEALAPLLSDHTIITDAASVKGSVVADGRRIFSDSLHRFVPGHPIAGSEQSGYQASRADLYVQRKVILTPLPENDPVAVRTVMQLWQGIGAEVHGMSADRHDAVLAGTSHLPHLLAYALVNTLVDRVSETDRQRQVFDYAAGGFADFSRIASSDPVMWRDIFLANTNATVNALDAYMETLQHMRQQLLRADGFALHYDFSRAKRVRDDFIKRFRHGVTQPLTANNWPVNIIARPGMALRGEYRAPASSALAIKILQLQAKVDVVSTYTGFPEDIAAQAAVQCLRDNGAMVVGPEQGKVTIYGAPDSSRELAAVPATVTARPADTELPADGLLSGLMILAASVITSSSMLIKAIDLRGVLAREQSDVGSTQTIFQAADQAAQLAPSVLPMLCELGVNVHVVRKTSLPWQTADVEVRTAASLQGRQFDLSANNWPEDQLLVLVVAGLHSNGETRLILSAPQTTSLLRRTQAWQHLGASITEHENGGVLIKHSSFISGQINCHGDTELAVSSLFIAQCAEAQLTIFDPGDIPGKYPGLLQSLEGLGFGLSFEEAIQS